MQQRHWRSLPWTMLIAVGVAFPLFYHLRWMPVKADGMDLALFERGISTPLLRTVNGYLGAFLNLRFIGGLAWIALPLTVWAVYRWKSMPRWVRGWIVCVWLGVVIIGVQGGFNYRYAITLLPVILASIFLALWHLLLRVGFSSRQRMMFFVVMILISGLNLGVALWHRRQVALSEIEEGRSVAARGGGLEELDTGPEDLEGMLARNGVGAGDKVLVNNLPVYYYVTSRPGVYYWCGSDQLFLGDGVVPWISTRDDAAAARYLIDSLQCRFVFSSVELTPYSERFSTFLRERCELLQTDRKGHTLHLVRKDA